MDAAVPNPNHAERAAPPGRRGGAHSARCCRRTRCCGGARTRCRTSATASPPTAQQPLVVALPETEAQVAAVLKACHALQVPVVARGAGTGLSGGAMPHALGVTLSLAKFNRIVKVDPLARTALVQCGVRNARDQRGGRAARPVLRARPVEPDRLHDRRQRGRELRRRALPEVRPDAAQRAEGARLHRRGRAGRVRRRRARRAGARPAGARGRQRRHAGGDDRGHRQAAAQAAGRALHHGQLRRRRAKPATRWPRSSPPA